MLELSFQSRRSFPLITPIVSVGLALLSIVGSAAVAEGQAGGVAAPRVQQEMLVSSEWLAGRTRDPGVVVLHVAANRNEYDAGHLPGARFVLLSSIMTERDGNINELPPVAQLDSVFESVGVSDATRVVLYGAPLSAARAFFTLDYLGHGDRTALLNGGLAGWRAAGQPVSTEAAQVTRGTFTPRPAPERVVDAEWVHHRIGDAGVALVDARPEAQYSGADAGAGIQRAGHIPGAGNVFWERLIGSTEHPVLRDPESMRSLFQAAGVAPGETVVTYCRSGMQASFAYFVARYLGYDARMYDGSFLDWSRRAELPVER